MQDLAPNIKPVPPSFFGRWWKQIVGIVPVVLIGAGAGLLFVPPPTAHGALKGHTVEISPNGTIQIVFSQWMNHRSVERSFSITPSTDGAITWNRNMLVFTPAHEFEKGSQFEVVVGTSAQSIWRKNLQQEFRQQFLVVDYPEVSVFAPVDGSTISQDQILSVLFDRPIRALTGDLAVPSFLQIDPDVAGEYHWLGTKGFEFVPKDGWPAATKFTVTIPAGTKVADGGSLTQDVVHTFQTAPLSVSMISQSDHHSTKEDVLLSFNYPVDPNVILGALDIHEGGVQLSRTEFSASVDEKNSTLVHLKKNNGFTLGKTYGLAIPQGFAANVGPLGLPESWSATMSTDELGFVLAGSSVDAGQEKAVYADIVFCFNNEADENTFDQITITPEVENKQVWRYGYLGDRCKNAQGMITLSGTWKPSAEYKISFGEGFHDRNGQSLPAQTTFGFRTSPYPPSVDVSTYGAQGVFASHLPRVYQVRTRNIEDPIVAAVYQIGLDGFLSNRAGGEQKIGTRSYETKAALNTYKINDLDLDAIAGKKLPNGYYQLQFNGQLESVPGNRSLVITDTALTVKRDRSGKVLVWGTDMKTGDVVPGLDVRISSLTYQDGADHAVQIGSVKTNAQGVAIFEGGAQAAEGTLVVEVSGGDHFGYTSTQWADGIDAWNYGLQRTYGPNQPTSIGFAYTDRRIYRPDQEVFFKGVMRSDTDANMIVPTGKTVQVRISDPEGTEVYSKELSLNAFGTFNDSLQLSPQMKLGAYLLNAFVVDAKSSQSVYAYFDVREYRRPDFKVEVQAPSLAFSGSSVRIPVHAEYYHGIPLKNVQVAYRVGRTKYRFELSDGMFWNDWYSFTTEEDGDCYWYCPNEGNYESVRSGELTLDDQGNAVIELPAELTDYKTSALYTVDVTVTDVNQRSVSSQQEFPVHKGDYYVGIRPDYSDGWGSQNAAFDVISVNADRSIRPRAAIAVKLLRRTWTSVKKTGADGNTFYDWQHADELVSTADVTTDVQGKGRVSFTPNKGGEYIALAESRDTQGRLISATAYRYVYRSDAGVSRVSDDHQMKIIQNKASYEVGDTASLVVQSPYPSAKALVTIERMSIREYRVVDLNADHRTVDLKITDGDTPNVYVSVLAVQGGGASNVPEFRLGYADLQVNTTKKILHMTVASDKERYRPGDTVTLTVQTNRNDGSPVSAETSIAVVDERVIALLGPIDKDILSRFWFPRLLGVDTGQTLTMLVKKIFFSTMEGGAGGKGDNSQTSPVRGNFRDTAFWKADLVTDANGKATISFKLPDNLTSWNVLAIGATQDTVVGQAETKIVTSRELMAEPILPRIVRYGDELQIGAMIINGTDAKIDTEVSVEAQGITVDGGVKKVTVPSKDRVPVRWTARVPMSGSSAAITVRVRGAGLEDAFTVSIPILDYSVPETVSASGILEKNVTETIEVPDGIVPNVGEVNVSVQPNIGNGLQSGLNYLVRYPYGCSEQQTSALLANLMYNQLVQLKVTSDSSGLFTSSTSNVQESIRQLLVLQQTDGGWGFWPEFSSRPWLTAYVLWGLTEAQKAGFAIDQPVLDRANTYLWDSLAYPEQSDDTRLTESEQAQVLFVLSERNPRGLDGFAATLYEHRSNLPVYAKLFLAMAYANMEQGRTSARANQLLGDARNRLIYLNPSTAYVSEDEGFWGQLSSDLRTSSLLVQALLRLDPRSEDIERIVRYIIQNRQDGYWYDTHDTANALLGLVAYARANPVSQTAKDVQVYLDNTLRTTLIFPNGDVSGAEQTAFPLADLGAGQSSHQIGLEKDSPTRYFYDINMSVRRQIADIESFENGMTVVAEVYGLSDAKYAHPLSELKQGESARVRMKLLVPKRRRYVAMEYHLPAGLEAVDFDLKTSPQFVGNTEHQCYPRWGGKLSCLQDWETNWWWEYVWRHIEQRDDRVFLFADTLEPGVYEYEFVVQAATPGTFAVPPARAYEFYNPTANAHTGGKQFTVVE